MAEYLYCLQKRFISSCLVRPWAYLYGPIYTRQQRRESCIHRAALAARAVHDGVRQINAMDFSDERRTVAVNDVSEMRVTCPSRC